MPWMIERTIRAGPDISPGPRLVTGAAVVLAVSATSASPGGRAVPAAFGRRLRGLGLVRRRSAQRGAQAGVDQDGGEL